MAPAETPPPCLCCSGDGSGGGSEGGEGGVSTEAGQRCTLPQTLLNFINIFVGTGL